MADIWVVETGEYSDYHVVGVFSTEENAQRVAKAKGYCTVDKWRLDPGIEEMNAGLVPFYVHMSDDGSTLKIYRLSGIDQHLNTSLELHRLTRATYGTVFARDEEHAIKIANEHRAQFIANGES